MDFASGTQETLKLSAIRESEDCGTAYNNRFGLDSESEQDLLSARRQIVPTSNIEIKRRTSNSIVNAQQNQQSNQKNQK